MAEFVVKSLQNHAEFMQQMDHNQKKLIKSAVEQDTYMHVLVRLLITQVNELKKIVRVLLKHHLEGDDVIHRIHDLPEDISPELVQAMFTEFNSFSERADFHEHQEAWYFGAALEDLPPPPEPEPKLEVVDGGKDDQAPSEDSDNEYPEGAVIFGGDYDSEAGNRVEGPDDQEEGGDVEVPSLPSSDGEESEPGDGEDGELLREVSPVLSVDAPVLDP